MVDWKSKLTSRKFWAAVVSFVALLVVSLGGTEAQATQITALIMAGATVIAYIVGEGLVDAASAGATVNNYDASTAGQQATTPPSTPAVDTVYTSAADGTPTGAAQTGAEGKSGTDVPTADNIAKAFMSALQSAQTTAGSPAGSGADASGSADKA